MKRTTLLSLAIIAVSAHLLMGCDNSMPNSPAASGVTEEEQLAFMTSVLDTIPLQILSAEEQSDLLYLREEEKLAHDVYQTLYAAWGHRTFGNIQKSEAMHTSAVLQLINRYNLTDPVGTNGVGVFANADLQKLYDDLVASGKVSLIDALVVGATIEDVDIADIKGKLLRTDNADIQLVYGNLERGSRNHMRAFVRSLTATGSSYTPKYISIEEFNAIIDGGMETRGRGPRR